MREKIKLESSAGTGHFYTTSKNKKNDAGEDGDQEVRSRRPQARDVQGNEAQVIGFGSARKARQPAGFLFFVASARRCPREEGLHTSAATSCAARAPARPR